MKKVFGTFIVAGVSLLSAETQFEQVYDGMLNGEMVKNLYEKHEDVYMPRPSLVDIDNDGDLDLFMGEAQGELHFYRNIGTKYSYNFVKEEGAYDSLVLDNNVALAFGDLDDDGDYDMLVGGGLGGGIGGNIKFFENIGDENVPAFKLITDTLNGIDAHDYSVPVLFDNDCDGDLDLLVGGGYGNLYYSANIGDKDSAVWDSVIVSYGLIDVGYKSTPSFYDVNNDGFSDLVIGNSWGRLLVYYADSIQNYNKQPYYFGDYEFGGSSFGNAIALIDDYLSPEFGDLDGDGDMDLIVSSSMGGDLKYIENQNDTFIWVEDNLLVNTLDIGKASTPLLKDITGDGVVDLLVGKSSGYVYYFRNDGTNENFDWTFITPDFFKRKINNFTSVEVVDIDNDGVVEFFVNSNLGVTAYFENIGDKSNNPTPELVTLNWNKAVFDTTISLYYTEMRFLDTDSDDDYDILLKDRNANLIYYENIGTPKEPLFEFKEDSLLSEPCYGNCGMTIFDLDNDGREELIIGNGRILVYDIDKSNMVFTFRDTLNIDISESSLTPTFVWANNKVKGIIGTYSGGVFLFSEMQSVNNKFFANYNSDRLNINIKNKILYTSFGESVKIEMYDFLGRKLLDKKISFGKQALSLKNYSGLYVLKIKTKDTILKEKVNLY